MKNYRILITALLFIITINSFGQKVVTGTATKVYDGDTFTLLTEQGEEMKIRIIGIDAPEKNQEHGIIARDFARSLIDGKTVRVYLEPGDTYGRKLGIVITPDGKQFSYEMVLNGHAWHYKKYNSDKYLAAAEKQARENKSGLWADADAQAPWEWRREN